MTTDLATQPEAVTAELIVNSDRSIRVGSSSVKGMDGVLQQAAVIATSLSKIISDRKLFKRIKEKDHVYCEGWTTLGAMLGVCVREVETVESETTKGEFIATVEAIRTSDGSVIGRASHSCGPDETEWAKRPRAARRSMAQTRATGKVMRLLFSWVMQLAGYSPTPMEEMGEEGPPEYDNPVHAPPAQTVQPRGERVTAGNLKALFEQWGRVRDHRSEPATMEEFKAWAAELTGIIVADVMNAAKWNVRDFEPCNQWILDNRGEDA